LAAKVSGKQSVFFSFSSANIDLFGSPDFQVNTVKKEAGSSTLQKTMVKRIGCVSFIDKVFSHYISSLILKVNITLGNNFDD
jgi:hypothetical protein